MIPTVLLIALPLGFVVGVSNRTGILTIGAVVTLFGWWILLFTVGDVDFSLGALVASGAFVLANLAVGVLIGWALGWGLRKLFGMTTQ